MAQTLDEVDLSSPKLLDNLLLRIGTAERCSASRRISYVAHRVVHGASLPQCITISSGDERNLETLDFLSRFAPLHNGPAVNLIKSCLECFQLSHPQVVNICCFDTCFHQSIPEVTWRYMIDDTLAGENLPGGLKLRKYGFHVSRCNRLLD